jgi:hypothetical protein
MVAFGDSSLQRAVVCGTVFADSNANGLRDPGEAGVDGVTVLLDGAETVTDEGAYSFTVPAPGMYTVTVVPPPGYIPVGPVSMPVSCSPYGYYVVDFGMVLTIPAAHVMGTVFEDLNRSGVQDSNEVGLAGVTVKLVLPGGTIPITTNLSGRYHFALPPGEAGEVIEINQPEYFSTTPDTVSVCLAPGEMCQVDFGDLLKVKVPVDIKPGACPNRVKWSSKKALAVAIPGTGTGEFEAAEIDPATISLEGVAPLAYSLRDITSPYEPFIGKEGCYDCAKSHKDGILDFEMEFDFLEIRSVVGTIGADTCVVLHLSGSFSDGFPFMGEDVLLLRTTGKPGIKPAPEAGRLTLSTGPNPAPGTATIRFSLLEPAGVRVAVHDILGREVAVIVDAFHEAGLHTEAWNGNNDQGHRAGPGVYFARIEADGLLLTSKIILVE